MTVELVHQGPGAAASPWRPEGAVTSLRRALTIVSVIALIPAAQGLWLAAVAPPQTAGGHLVPPHLLHGVLLMVAVLAFGVLLLSAVVAIGAPQRRAWQRVDGTLLVVGVLLAVGWFLLSHRANDEGALTARAAYALLHGQHVYGVNWPDVFRTVPLTKTMNGGGDYQYGYPPLGVLLTTVTAAVLHHSTIAAPLVTMAAFVVAALVLWLRVPTVWRPAVTVVMLALDPLAGFARGGSPILIAILLLIPVVLRFDRTGLGDRLGPVGLAKGAALGAACAAHQLAWFVVPFVAVALFLLRTRELGPRRAALLLVRYAGAAAAVWVLINLPFVVMQPRAWLGGILLPLRQHAIVHGQGLVDIPYLLTSGSGALDLFSTAAILLLLGLLVAVVLFPGRLGPAIVVLPASVFYVTTRAPYEYWVQFTPLWLAMAATVPLDRFRRAWRPRRIDAMAPRAKGALAALLVAPALAVAGVAAFAPPPLSLHLLAAIPATGHPGRIAELRLTARNQSSHPVTPHFAYRVTGGASNWWVVREGPKTLRAGQHATYTIGPSSRQVTLQPNTAIIVVSDRPMTISVLPVSG